MASVGVHIQVGLILLRPFRLPDSYNINHLAVDKEERL